MSDRVAVAVVGAGRMGGVHLRALGRTMQARLAAVVEPFAAARERAARLGVPTHASVEKLLSAGGIDGVVITAPTDLHLELVERLAAAGLPILCEKPCGLTSG